MGRLRALALPLCLVLAACQSEPEVPDYGIPGYNPDPAALAQSCKDSGGRYQQSGLAGRFVCLKTPADAGKSCSKSSDCESECLARSRTCAPVKPLFGCNEILDGLGRPVTLCVD